MSHAATSAIRALVLTRAHHCLLVRAPDGFRVPEVTGLSPARPLLAIKEHVRAIAGLALPSPSGSLVPPDGRGPRDFVFLVDTPSVLTTEAFTYAPLSRALGLAAATGHDRSIWQMYVTCMLGGWEPPTRAIDVFSFGDDPEMAAKLVHLVTCGEKRGTASWLRAAERAGATIPQPGLISIVTDGFGFPRCAIETVEVRTLPFADIDERLAALEGEGDLTLTDWRDAHRSYFGREAKLLSLAFDETEALLAERFRVLHIVGRRDEG